MRVASGVSGLELADYQKAVRLVLRHPLVTAGYPNEKALPLVRRWSPQLRADLAEAFGYRLELRGDTARLLRVVDELDPGQPAVTRTGKTFDRSRYAYLSLVLAALGRAGIQVALTELADAVAADAGRIPGLGFAADSYSHRMAFVDAVANHLRGPALAEDLERLTGLWLERRAEGVALIDTAGWSEHRFPGTGAAAQAALLLAAEIADRIADPDASPPQRLPAPTAAQRRADLVALVDAGLPAAATLAGADAATEEPTADETPPAMCPFLLRAWLRSTVDGILQRYAAAFGEKWLTDPDRLLAEALDVLIKHRLAAPVPGGVLALPLLGRYRIVTATVRRRAAVSEPALFEVDA